MKTACCQDSVYKTARPVFVHSSLLYDFPQSYGLSAGVAYPFAAVIKNRILKDGKTFTKQKDKLWGIEAAVYRYPYNHTGILLVPFVGVRHYVNERFSYETALGIGVLRTFYDGKVYLVDASGNITEKSLFGRYYATTHLSSAINFLLQKPGSKVLVLQVKPSLWFQYPFESFIKPHISLEAGLKYEINNRSVRTRETNKRSKK